jgi:ABC-type antimicrobial peptide transport system permease subunit
MALGARRARVLAAILRQFLWPVAIGMVTGALTAAALSRLLRVGLYGVSNLDPIGYLSAVFVLVGIMVVAAILPARRALRLDIAAALHHE